MQKSREMRAKAVGSRSKGGALDYRTLPPGTASSATVNPAEAPPAPAAFRVPVAQVALLGASAAVLGSRGPAHLGARARRAPLGALPDPEVLVA